MTKTTADAAADVTARTAAAAGTVTARAADAITAGATAAGAAGTPTAAAPAPATTTAPATAAEQLIADRRRRIDDLDTRIIALVRERVSVSGEIQAARIGAGGRRVHLARELEILRAYGDALGRPGTAVAMTLLELCRGTAWRDHPNGS